MGYLLAVNEYYPLANAVDIARDTTVWITFNRDVKVDTLDGNFKVDKRIVSGETVSYEPVAGEITYASKQAVFTPDSDLVASTIYRVTLIGDDPATSDMDGVQDIFGDGIIGTMIYTFTTNDDVVLAKPVLTAPLDNFTYAVLPNITWDAVINVTDYYVEISPAADFSVHLWDTTISDGSHTILPLQAVVDGTYYIRIRYTIGTDYSPWSDSLRIFIDADVADTVAVEEYLIIESISPGGTYNLATNVVFTIIFDEAVTSSVVKLIDYPISETIISPVMDVTNKIMTVTPPNLATNKQYVLYIEASSTSGTSPNLVVKELMDPLELVFTTVYSPLFSTYSDVSMEIGSLIGRLTPNAVYSGIKEASIYVQQIRLAVEAANPILTVIDWTDTANLPLYITQYAKYAGAANALINLLIEKSDHSGELRTLGDFTIQDYTGSESGIEKVLDMLNNKAKMWLDQVYEMGTSRGYAKPVSATRGLESSPYPTYHTRTITTT